MGKSPKSCKGSASTLTDKLGAQKKQVDQLEKAYQESVRTKGKDAEETQILAQKLEKSKAKVEQTKKALEAVNQQIKLN